MERTGSKWIYSAAALCALLTGCISVNQENRYRALKNTDDDGVTQDVAFGKTTREALVQRLGSPNSAWREANGEEVLRWDNEREARTRIRVFPLLSLSLAKESAVRYFFVVNSGVVVRYWREAM